MIEAKKVLEKRLKELYNQKKALIKEMLRMIRIDWFGSKAEKWYYFCSKKEESICIRIKELNHIKKLF